MEKNKKITYQDITAFLLNAYFGDVCDPICTAVNSAYLDLNRTIEFKKAKVFIPEEKKADIRQSCVGTIKTSVIELLGINDLDEKIYDSWHEGLCESIIGHYSNDVHFYYGQAQKWVNMTFKYLTVIEPQKTENLFDYLHVPIDSVILDIAVEELELERPRSRWSRMPKDEYIRCQLELRSKIREKTGLSPLLWEFRSWSR